MFARMHFALKNGLVVCGFFVMQVQGSLTVSKCCDEQTAMQAHCKEDVNKIIVLSSGFKTTALIEAINHRDYQSFKRLVDAKADPNLSGGSIPPLSYLLAQNRDDENSCFAAVQLLNLDANPSKADNQKMTPLHYVCCKPTPFAKTVKALLVYGADYSLSASGCGTPYEIVAAKQSDIFKDKLHLLRSMQMFQSYQHSQTWKSSAQAWEAFWSYVDGCPEPLAKIVKNNQEAALACLTPWAVEQILKNAQSVRASRKCVSFVDVEFGEMELGDKDAVAKTIPARTKTQGLVSATTCGFLPSDDGKNCLQS